MTDGNSENVLLKGHELAKKLGVPVNTIYYWVSKNEIPYIKMGKHNRFVYQEVVDFFKNKTMNKKLSRQERG